MDQILEHLKGGVRRFQTEVYPQQAEIFAQSVSIGQRPHTLFMTCADSRIDPIAITSSGPGEIFVTRNIGNMVPTFGEMLGGVSAVIEFAVSSLKVGHIVICGHTHCGAMQALIQPESVANLPAVKNWIENAHEALVTTEASNRNKNGESFIDELTEQNVLLQMKHLKTHPSVAKALSTNSITISGWIYRIDTGEIHIAEDGENNFAPIGSKLPTGA
jgi:carbonic anhydrase